MSTKKRKVYARKLFIQKLMGLGILAISVFVIWLAANGETVEERDITPVLFMIPLGISLLFSKEILLLD